MGTGQINHDLSEPNMPIVAVVIISIFVFVMATTFAAVGFYAWTKTTLYKSVEMAYEPQDLYALRAYESEELHQLKWINQQQKKVKLPIDIAKQAVINDYLSR